MKAYEQLQNEVQLTLEKIAKTNGAIARHEAQEKRDNLAIQQYRDFKKQLTNHLLDLLEQMDIRFDVAA
jgi:hypothetical protein